MPDNLLNLLTDLLTETTEEFGKNTGDKAKTVGESSQYFIPFLAVCVLLAFCLILLIISGVVIFRERRRGSPRDVSVFVTENSGGKRAVATLPKYEAPVLPETRHYDKLNLEIDNYENVDHPANDDIGGDYENPV